MVKHYIFSLDIKGTNSFSASLVFRELEPELRRTKANYECSEPDRTIKIFKNHFYPSLQGFKDYSHMINFTCVAHESVWMSSSLKKHQ